MSPDRSDRDLVLAFKQGDRAAYDEMYARYRGRVYGVCSRILRNPQDAEEAAQETFLRAFQALHRFNGRYQLGAWLARIAANTSVDQLRTKARAPVAALVEGQEPPTSDDDPESIVIGGHPRLDDAIRDVKPLHARALAMRAVEGMSHQEIAERLAITPAQVKALLHRARGSLRKAWDRAEGWLLAPVFSVRAMFGSRSEHQASPLLTAGGPLSPLLAERVAATALVVAVALGGFPTPPPHTTGDPSTGSATPKNLAGPVRPEAAPEASDGSVAPARSEAEAPAEKDLTVAVSRLIEETLKGHNHLESRNDEPDEGEQNGLPPDPATTASNVVDEVGRVLPHGGPGSPLAVDTR